MNQNQTVLDVDNVGNDEIDVVYFLKTAWTNRKYLIGIPIICSVLAIAVSFSLPTIFKANTRIFPPQQSQSSASAIISQLGGIAGGAASSLGVKNPNDMYISMLKSRTIQNNIAEKFQLKDVYNKKSLQEARKTLDANSIISSGKDGIITIEVEDIDPVRAADISNAYVDEIKSLTSKFAMTEASYRRVFFEKQLMNAKEKMSRAEHQISLGLAQNGIQSIDVQSKTVIETTAKLRAAISAKEIQIKSMQAFLTASHPELKKATQELGAMNDELFRLENGSGKNPKESSGLNTNFENLREVKYYQSLVEILSKQYEVARLDEAKDIPLIQVLDKAEVPERKDRPKALVMAVTSGLIGFFVVLIWIFSKNYVAYLFSKVRA